METVEETSTNKDDQSIWRYGHHTALLLTLIVALLVFVLVVNQMLTFEVGYSLSARTELVEIELHDQLGEKVQLPDVFLPRSSKEYHHTSLRLLNGTVITMQRLEKGDLRMQVGWPPGGHGARLITADGEEVELADNEPLVISSHEGSMTLSFKGKLRLGQQTARDMAGVMLSGRVTIAEKVPLKSARYIISDSTLDAGDSPLWLDSSGTPVEVAGFVHLDDDQAMLVVAHADADHVTVQRYGGRDYEISPEWWDRFAHDPYLSSTVAILGCLSGVAIWVREVENLSWKSPGAWTWTWTWIRKRRQSLAKKQ